MALQSFKKKVGYKRTTKTIAKEERELKAGEKKSYLMECKVI